MPACAAVGGVWTPTDDAGTFEAVTTVGPRVGTAALEGGPLGWDVTVVPAGPTTGAACGPVGGVAETIRKRLGAAVATPIVLTPTPVGGRIASAAVGTAACEVAGFNV